MKFWIKYFSEKTFHLFIYIMESLIPRWIHQSLCNLMFTIFVSCELFQSSKKLNRMDVLSGTQCDLNILFYCQQLLCFFNWLWKLFRSLISNFMLRWIEFNVEREELILDEILFSFRNLQKQLFHVTVRKGRERETKTFTIDVWLLIVCNISSALWVR